MKTLAVLLFFLTSIGWSQTVPRKVTLTWQHPATDVTYNVYRAPGGCTGTPAFSKINTAPVTAKSYEDMGLDAGVYCYTVRASREGVESVNSNLAGATVAPPVITPDAPTGLNITVTVQVQVSGQE